MAAVRVVFNVIDCGHTCVCRSRLIFPSKDDFQVQALTFNVSPFGESFFDTNEILGASRRSLHDKFKPSVSNLCAENIALNPRRGGGTFIKILLCFSISNPSLRTHPQLPFATVLARGFYT